MKRKRRRREVAIIAEEIEKKRQIKYSNLRFKEEHGRGQRKD